MNCILHQGQSLQLQTNGIYERFDKMIKTECNDILFRHKIYTQLSEIQNVVNQWLEFYNR
jgi:transposase InsO family protein